MSEQLCVSVTACKRWFVDEEHTVPLINLGCKLKSYVIVPDYISTLNCCYFTADLQIPGFGCRPYTGKILIHEPMRSDIRIFFFFRHEHCIFWHLLIHTCYLLSQLFTITPFYTVNSNCMATFQHIEKCVEIWKEKKKCNFVLTPLVHSILRPYKVIRFYSKHRVKICTLWEESIKKHSLTMVIFFKLLK